MATTLKNTLLKNTVLRPWNEADIKGLLVDLSVKDFSTLTFDGSKISAMAGRNGTIYNASQASGALQGTYGIEGGNPVIRFDEGAMELGALPAFATGYTIFVAVKYNSVGGGSPQSHPMGCNAKPFYKSANANTIRNSHNTLVVNHATTITAVPLLQTARWNGDLLQGYINGVLDANDGNILTALTSQDWFVASVRADGVVGLQGDFYKLLIYDRALSDAEVATVNSFIINEIGIV